MVTNSVFTVASGVTATIANLNITGGSANTGGGINNNGTLTVTQSTISGNFAVPSSGIFGTGGIGGGIYNSTSLLTLSQSTVSGNTAIGSISSPAQGGGIYAGGGSGPSFTATNSTIANNTVILANGTVAGQGGGIANYLIPISLTGVTITGNSAAIGGGMYVSGSSIVLTDTIVGRKLGYQLPRFGRLLYRRHQRGQSYKLWQ